jgi:regulation of enolase protein 1 (concanavalin A-like superfamily)
MEYETEHHSRLGSVVTNLGYSDWATIDINTKINTMWYRIQSKKNDFSIEYSDDGFLWKQLRISHLHSKFNEIQVGIYACSPMKSSFDVIFDNFVLGKTNW